MDFLDLDDEVLNDVQKVMSYDSSIPLHYRILGKLNYNDDLRNCIRFIEANRSLFMDEYAYLMLESAVEMCLNSVVNEDGEIFNLSDIPKNHTYKPAPMELEYIEYLLKNGASPLLPKHFNQYEHIEDMEEDSETCFSISAVDCFKLHIVHSECDKVLAYLARLGVLRWGFALGGFGRFCEIHLARFRDFQHWNRLGSGVLGGICFGIIGQRIRLHFVRIGVGKFLRKLLDLLMLEQLCKEAFFWLFEY